MTNEELAKHWNTSLQEVKRISDIMNEAFYCGVSQSKTDHLFYGVMFRWHISPSGNRTPMLAASSKKGFPTEKEAVQNWNNLLDQVELPKLKAELMEVPRDAYKALKKIPEPIRTHQRHIVSIWRDKKHIKA